MKNIGDWSWIEVLKAALLLAAAIELVTVTMRFGVGLQSTRDAQWLARWTFGIRVHHGYIGAVLLVATHFFEPRIQLRNAAYTLGAALVISDLVHHFLVLWPTTGTPQFDLFYGSKPEK